MAILFLIGRIIYGGFFVWSGLNHFRNRAMLEGYAASKGVSSPSAAVIVSGLLMLLGGLGIMLGVKTEWAVLCLVLFLVPVSFKMHNFWAVSDPNQKMMDQINFTKNLALAGAALMFLMIESWPYSLGY